MATPCSAPQGAEGVVTLSSLKGTAGRRHPDTEPQAAASQRTTDGRC